MLIHTKNGDFEILAYENLAATLPCPLMKLVSLVAVWYSFFISVAEQVGGEQTGNVLFCSLDIMEHI